MPTTAAPRRVRTPAGPQLHSWTWRGEVGLTLLRRPGDSLFLLSATRTLVKLALRRPHHPYEAVVHVWNRRRPASRNRTDLFLVGRQAIAERFPQVFLDKLMEDGTPSERELAEEAARLLASASG